MMSVSKKRQIRPVWEYFTRQEDGKMISHPSPPPPPFFLLPPSPLSSPQLVSLDLLSADLRQITREMKEATAELINNRQNKPLKVQYDIVSLHPLYDCVL